MPKRRQFKRWSYLVLLYPCGLPSAAGYKNLPQRLGICYQPSGAPLPHLFTLTTIAAVANCCGAVILCGTITGLAVASQTAAR